MNNLAANHLTDEQLDDVLMGIAEPAASAHLASCDPCGERLLAFQTQLYGPMAAFNQATLAWSEARSNTITRDLSAHRPTPRLTLTTIWSAAAACVLALTFGIAAATHHAESPLQTASVTQTSTDTDQEIASDNAMLSAIGSEIVTPQPDQFGLYKPTKAGIAANRHTPSQQVRD